MRAIHISQLGQQRRYLSADCATAYYIVLDIILDIFLVNLPEPTRVRYYKKWLYITSSQRDCYLFLKRSISLLYCQLYCPHKPF